MVDLYAPERFSVLAALSRPVRIARNRPGAFWALVCAEFAILCLLVAVFGHGFVESRGFGGEVQTLSQAFAIEKRAEAMLPWLIPAASVWWVLSGAGWLRLLVGGAQRPMPPYQFWKDELRYLAVLLVYAAAFCFFALLCVIAAYVLWVPYITLVVLLLASGAEGMPPGLELTHQLLVWGVTLAVLFAIIRIGCSPAVSTAQQTIKPFSGWAATSGIVLKFLAAQFAVAIFFAMGAIVIAIPIAYLLADRQLRQADGVEWVLLIFCAVGAIALLLSTLALARSVNAEATLAYLETKRKLAANPTPP